MQTCPRCGQVDVDESHQCAPTALAAERGTGVGSAIAALVILVLSFGLFAATLTFTLLHQQASAAPVIIQTTLPTNAVTVTSTASETATPPAAIAPTATTATHAGTGGGGVAHPTATPSGAPPPTTPPFPTAVPPPPTPTDVPPPTPTRVPQ